MADDRPWYVLLQDSNEFVDKFDCPVGIVSSPQSNFSLHTSLVYDIGWVQNFHSLSVQFAAVDLDNVRDVVSVHRVVWVINIVTLNRRLTVINLNNISSLR